MRTNDRIVAAHPLARERAARTRPRAGAAAPASSNLRAHTQVPSPRRTSTSTSSASSSTAARPDAQARRHATAAPRAPARRRRCPPRSRPPRPRARDVGPALRAADDDDATRRAVELVVAELARRAHERRRRDRRRCPTRAPSSRTRSRTTETEASSSTGIRLSTARARSRRRLGRLPLDDLHRRAVGRGSTSVERVDQTPAARQAEAHRPGRAVAARQNARHVRESRAPRPRNVTRMPVRLAVGDLLDRRPRPCFACTQTLRVSSEVAVVSAADANESKPAPRPARARPCARG